MASQVASSITPLIVSSWPDHLVPICTDGQTNQPFPYVLDIAHLIDYSLLQYYPMPTKYTPPPPQSFTSATASSKPAASGSADKAAQRRKSMVAFAEAAHSALRKQRSSVVNIELPDVDGLLATAGDMMATTGDLQLETTTTLSSLPQEDSRKFSSKGTSTVLTNKKQIASAQERWEINTNPTGSLLLVGAHIAEPAIPDIKTAAQLESLSENFRTLTDDERLHCLHIPNQKIFLKPISTSQRDIMMEMLSKWIRVSNQQMFNSRMLILRAEFSAILLQRPGEQADDGGKMFQQQQALKEDVDFCRGLTSAIFAFGSFSNAREAVNEKGVPEDVNQRRVVFPPPPEGTAPIDAAMMCKFSTVVLPFSFGTLDRISVAVKHESQGWFVPAHQRGGVALMQLLAHHDITKQPHQIELTMLHEKNSTQANAPTGRGGRGGKQSRRSHNPHTHSKIRVVCNLSWIADENHSLQMRLRASGLLRRDFSLADPVCFVNAKSQDEIMNSGAESNSATGAYKYISEAYRNKLEAEFAPISLALPMELPEIARNRNVADFVNADPTAVLGKGANAHQQQIQATASKILGLPSSTAPSAASEKKTPMITSKLFPPNVLPAIPLTGPTLADIQTENQMMQNTVSTMHRYGDDVLLPCVQPSDTLSIEIVDCVYDAASQDTLPSLIGTALLSVDEILAKGKEFQKFHEHIEVQKAMQRELISSDQTSKPLQIEGTNAAEEKRLKVGKTPLPPKQQRGGMKLGRSPAAFSFGSPNTLQRPEPIRIPLATGLPGAVNINASTALSTVERLRQRQKKRFPIDLNRFVFATVAEATSSENAQMVNRSVAFASPEVAITDARITHRPSFLRFFQGGSWDMSSIIVIDCTSSSMWSHFNSFLPNDLVSNHLGHTHVAPAAKNSTHRNQESKGKNIYETLIVAINKLLIPMLTRGGSDLFMVATAPDGSAPVIPLHCYPEGFGVYVDETSLSERRTNASAVFEGSESGEGQDDHDAMGHGQRKRSDQSAGGSISLGDLRSPSHDAIERGKSPNGMEPLSSTEADAVKPTTRDEVEHEIRESQMMAQDPLSVANESFSNVPSNPLSPSNKQGGNSPQSPPASPTNAGKKGINTQVFSAIRDWGGEATLPAYRAKFDGIVHKARAAAGLINPMDEFLEKAAAEIQGPDGGGAEDGTSRKIFSSKSVNTPPPPSDVSKQPMSLVPILRRVMARCVALSNARHATIHRANKLGMPIKAAPRVYHIVTIVVHSEVSDASECVPLLLSWLARPVFFVLIFLDEASSPLFSGVANCITVDMTCCSRHQIHEQRPRGDSPRDTELFAPATTPKGKDKKEPEKKKIYSLINYEVPLLAVHKQLKAVEQAVGRIPLAFLSFARLAGIQVPTPPAEPMHPYKLLLEHEAAGGNLHDFGGLREVAAVVKDAHHSKPLDDATEFEVHLRQFDSAQKAFLKAFGFDKKSKGPSPPPGGKDELRHGRQSLGQRNASLAKAAPVEGSILATGKPGGHNSEAKPTFTGEGESSTGEKHEAAGGGASQQGDSADPSAVTGTEIALPQPPKDLRAAQVSVVDVYMDDQQVREWETDPQHLKAKMQVIAAQRQAAVQGKNNPAGGSGLDSQAMLSSFQKQGVPLIDDTLIRMHLQRLQTIRQVNSPTNSSNVDDDVDDESVLSAPADPDSPVRVFKQKVRHEGQMKQVSVRISGMEGFVAKLPMQPQQQRKGAGANNNANNSRRRSSVGAPPQPTAGGAQGRRGTEGQPASDQNQNQGSNEPQGPLTARQMAEKREKEETDKMVQRALRKIILKNGQHALKPHIHTRILTTNHQLEEKRRKEAALLGEVVAGEDDVASSFSDAEALQKLQRAQDVANAEAQESEPKLLEFIRPFKQYLTPGQQQMHLDLVRRRIYNAEDHKMLCRPQSAKTTRNGDDDAPLPSPGSFGRGGILSRPKSANRYETLLSSNSSATRSQRRVDDGRPGAPAGATRVNGRSAAVDGDEEQEGNIRFQQLSNEKRMKLNALMSCEKRSYGGPKLNEDLIFEQEAELERRRIRESRRKEAERIEEAFRKQKQLEQLEKNRLKLKHVLRAVTGDLNESEDESNVLTH